MFTFCSTCNTYFAKSHIQKCHKRSSHASPQTSRTSSSGHTEGNRWALAIRRTIHRYPSSINEDQALGCDRQYGIKAEWPMLQSMSGETLRWFQHHQLRTVWLRLLWYKRWSIRSIKWKSESVLMLSWKLLNSSRKQPFLQWQKI